MYKGHVTGNGTGARACHLLRAYTRPSPLQAQASGGESHRFLLSWALCPVWGAVSTQAPGGAAHLQ